MRVLTIMSKLEMGGIEKTLLSCIPFLDKMGIKMTIICSLGGALDTDFQSLGVTLINFGKHKKPFKDAKFLKEILAKDKFDLVHSRLGHTSGLFAKVCYELSIPFVVSIHNEKAMFRNNWIGKPILAQLRSSYLSYHKRLTLKYASKIIGHSKANLRYYTSDYNKDRLFEVLYNGVDFSKLDEYESLSKEKQIRLDQFLSVTNKVFIHIGSFKEQKNHNFLIDVFNATKPVENKFKLILMGEGALRKDIEAKVKKLGLSDNVLFTGMETNVAPYLNCADIFVFPSLYEGFGNVLIEAQYMNLGICASAIAPHYEAVYSGYHSYFFDSSNIKDAATKLKSLASLEKGDVISERAYVFAKKFSINNMVENLKEIYIRALKPRNVS